MWVQVPEEEREEMSMQIQFMGAVRVGQWACDCMYMQRL